MGAPLIYLVVLHLQSIIFSNEIKGLEVTYSITGCGMTAIPNGSGGIQGFERGSFSPFFFTFLI